jgi:hypothetical protein
MSWSLLELTFAPQVLFFVKLLKYLAARQGFSTIMDFNPDPKTKIASGTRIDYARNL